MNFCARGAALAVSPGFLPFPAIAGIIEKTAPGKGRTMMITNEMKQSWARQTAAIAKRAGALILNSKIGSVTEKGGTMIYSTIKTCYDFISAEDGSSLSATVIGEGMDTGDKASNKAMSVAFKYACFQVLCIPTEEMVDPNADTPEPSRDAGAALEAAKREAASLGIDPVKVSNYYKVPVDQLGLREYNDAIRMKRERGAR